MHGIIFNQLFKFVRENHGFEAMDEIMKEAGLNGKFYDATKSHADQDIFAIVEAACKKLNASKDDVLEAFGEFLVPALMKTFFSYLLPSWRTIDLLSHIENTMHKTARISQPGALPPQLDVQRINQNEVNIKYYSKRKMHSLGIGLIKGIASHYQEDSKLKIDVSDIDDGKLIHVAVAD